MLEFWCPVEIFIEFHSHINNLPETKTNKKKGKVEFLQFLFAILFEYLSFRPGFMFLAFSKTVLGHFFSLLLDCLKMLKIYGKIIFIKLTCFVSLKDYTTNKISPIRMYNKRVKLSI